MSVDHIGGPTLPSTLSVAHPIDTSHTGDAFAPAGGEMASQLIVAGQPVETVDALLQSVAHGNHAAFVALQSRMASLVRVNVRRILDDAARSEAVTEEIFAEVLEDADTFDPQRASAQTWLLTRTYQHAMDKLRSIEGANNANASTSDSPAEAAAS
ncbi:MAG: sigma factor [Nitriliruptoraceae bacterium]